MICVGTDVLAHDSCQKNLFNYNIKSSLIKPNINYLG